MGVGSGKSDSRIVRDDEKTSNAGIMYRWLQCSKQMQGTRTVAGGSELTYTGVQGDAAAEMSGCMEQTKWRGLNEGVLGLMGNVETAATEGGSRKGPGQRSERRAGDRMGG